jgi:hypothetical protein
MGKLFLDKALGLRGGVRPHLGKALQRVGEVGLPYSSLSFLREPLGGSRRSSFGLRGKGGRLTCRGRCRHWKRFLCSARRRAGRSEFCACDRDRDIFPDPVHAGCRRGRWYTPRAARAWRADRCGLSAWGKCESWQGRGRVWDYCGVAGLASTTCTVTGSCAASSGAASAAAGRMS